MRIKKVKYNGRQVYVEYDKPRPDGSTEVYTLLSDDAPTRAFVDALRALSPHVVTLCEFAGGDVDVRGCAFTWADDRMGCVITALKSIAHAAAPLVVNTPYLTEPAPRGPSGPRLPGSVVIKLRTVIAETERFVKGARAQGGLFDSRD
jgi:hypothetical protein